MRSLDNLVYFFFKVYEAVSVDVASVHANGQIVALEKLKGVFFVFQEVLTLG